jgi:hypothetical protein
MNLIKLLGTVGLFAALLFTPASKAQDAKLASATLAVYHGKQECGYVEVPSFFWVDKVWTCEFKAKFTCTATVIETDGDGSYLALTAGHCFAREEKDSYYVSAEVSDHPVVNKIELVKYEDDDRYDYAIIKFHSIREYPAIPVDTTTQPEIGSQVDNVNFAFGLTKMYTHGVVESGLLNPPSKGKSLTSRYYVNIGIGPGASGSAVVQNGKIVGIVEAIFPGTQMPSLIMPMGKQFLNFVDDDSASIDPLPEPKKTEEPVKQVPKKKTSLFGRLFEGSK